MPAVAKDMTGLVFGRLTVIRKSETAKTKNYVAWVTRCICGKEHTVAGVWLRGGKSRSCGCLGKEASAANAKKASAARLAAPRKPKKPRPIRKLPPNLALAHAVSKARKNKLAAPGMFSARLDRPRPQGVNAGKAVASMFGQPHLLRERREELRILMEKVTVDYVERMRQN